MSRAPELARNDAGARDWQAGTAAKEVDLAALESFEAAGVAGTHHIVDVIEKVDRYGQLLERFCGECGLLVEPAATDLVHVPDESPQRRAWFPAAVTLAALPVVGWFDPASALGLTIAGVVVSIGVLGYVVWRPRAAARLAGYHAGTQSRDVPGGRFRSFFDPWRR